MPCGLVLSSSLPEEKFTFAGGFPFGIGCFVPLSVPDTAVAAVDFFCACLDVPFGFWLRTIEMICSPVYGSNVNLSVMYS